jgi:hypothetical protein
MRNRNRARDRLTRQRWYQQNREKILAQRAEKLKDPAQRQKKRALERAYRAAKPYKMRARWLKQAYGLTPAERDAIFAAQGFVCAICRSSDPAAAARNRRLWHTDHNHETGAVRGILCAHCNRGLGSFRDSVGLLQAAIDYLRAAQVDPERVRPTIGPLFAGSAASKAVSPHQNGDGHG